MNHREQNQQAGNSATLARIMVDGRVELTASGAWTAAHTGEISALLEATAAEESPRSQVNITIGIIRELDTFGAWLLERLLREGGGKTRSATFPIVIVDCLITYTG